MTWASSCFSSCFLSLSCWMSRLCRASAALDVSRSLLHLSAFWMWIVAIWTARPSVWESRRADLSFCISSSTCHRERQLKGSDGSCACFTAWRFFTSSIKPVSISFSFSNSWILSCRLSWNSSRSDVSVFFLESRLFPSVWKDHKSLQWSELQALCGMKTWLIGGWTVGCGDDQNTRNSPFNYKNSSLTCIYAIVALMTNKYTLLFSINKTWAQRNKAKSSFDRGLHGSLSK